jgi:hypothetical protein
MTLAYQKLGAPSIGSVPRARLSRSQWRLLASARTLANLFDTRFSIFGFRFGLDPVLGLIPGIGDVVSAIASVYMIFVGRQMGVSNAALLRMVVIAGTDFLIGLIPFVGDVGDAIFKAHVRNLRIIEEHLRRVEGDARPL